MRLLSICLLVIFGILTASSIIARDSGLSRRSIGAPIKRDGVTSLEKRKGGGGGGARGGGGSSGGSRPASGGSSGGSSSGARGSPRTYGGGGYYGGGATTAYRSGGRTPSGLLPVGLLGIGALTFFSGAWLYGAYLYPYSRPYGFYNRTSNRNESKPVQCLCQEYSDCGCDDNNNSTFLSSVIGDGTNLNNSLVRVADVNGTSQIFINGTLDNGTVADSTTSAAVMGVRMPPVVSAVMLASVFATALLAL